MAFKTSGCFLMAIIFFFITSISSSHPYTFQVGGKDGWTLHPSENYNNWAGRLRFLINDTLHFKYDGSSDSVLVVNRSDYDGCNGNNPVLKLEGGDSTFKFDRSGPFYFITGNKSNCDQGQKLIVVVLAVRNRSPPPSAATPPSPTALPPSPEISPVFPPSPVSTPPAPSPGGGAPTPGGGGAPSPGGEGGAPTPGTTGGGGGAPPPGTGTGGGGAPSPGSGGGNNPSADTTSPPPPSAATSPLSGGLTALGVTVIFALWGI
ncbi:early nodulin-like protein 2 [Helianthus annuus]|uniref:early nodulin-like protein 2 n=1 Tax=Helianthus annuus TaxID=4232 RepID=UPI000B908A33|nr:early nodulin-like protein 2 [Helianthus annuus]KAJ0496265.1 putative Phytocyanin domain, cupredoxin [Helianthus annuus]